MAAAAAGATCGAVNSRPLQGKEQQPAVSQDCRLLLYRGERGLSLSHEILYLEVGDSALEAACLLQGEEEGGDVVVGGLL